MTIRAIDDTILSWFDKLLQFVWQEFGWTRNWVCRVSIGVTMLQHIYAQASESHSMLGTFFFAMWVAILLTMHYNRVEKRLGLAPQVINKYIIGLRESEQVMRLLFMVSIVIFDMPVLLSNPAQLFTTLSSLIYFFISVAFVPMEPREPKTKLVFQT